MYLNKGPNMWIVGLYQWKKKTNLKVWMSLLTSLSASYSIHTTSLSLLCIIPQRSSSAALCLPAHQLALCKIILNWTACLVLNLNASFLPIFTSVHFFCLRPGHPDFIHSAGCTVLFLIQFRYCQTNTYTSAVYFTTRRQKCSCKEWLFLQ